MDRETEARFQRIEANLEYVTEQQKRFDAGMIKLEAAQDTFSKETREHIINLSIVLGKSINANDVQRETVATFMEESRKFVEESRKRGAELDERIVNLGIVVDQLARTDDALRERLTKFTEESNKRGADLDERLRNMIILVNELIKRDLNGHRGTS